MDLSEHDLKRATLNSGLEIWVKEIDDPNEMVSIRLVIGVGSAHMPLHKLALPHFVEHLAFDCRREGRIKQLSDEIERTGGFLNAETGQENTICKGDARVDHLTDYFELLRLLLTKPDFSQERVSREQKVVFSEMDETENWDYFYTLLRKMYGDHPLAYSPIGTCSSLIGIAQQDVEDFFQRYYVGNNMILICVGGVEFDEVVRAAAEKLEFARSESVEWPDYEQPSVARMPISHRDHRYDDVIVYGYRTGGYVADDYYALWFLSHYLQELLHDEVRAQGLTYAFDAYYWTHVHEGLFYFYFKALGTTVARILDILEKVMLKVQDSLIDDTVFREKRDKLVNSFRNAISDRRELADVLQYNLQHYKRGRELRHDFEELQALTPERIREVAEKHFRKQRHFEMLASNVDRYLYGLLRLVGVYIFLAWLSFRFYSFVQIRFPSLTEEILVILCSLLLLTLVLVVWEGRSVRQTLVALRDRLSRAMGFKR